MQHEHHNPTAPTNPHSGHAAHAEAGGQHAAHDHTAMISDFLRRFWVCLVLTVPVVAFSPMFQHIAGYALDFPGRNWLTVALATVIFGYGGKPFLVGMLDELRRRETGMMTLIAVAISTAYLYSTAVAVGWLAGMDFYWELATLIVIMLLGHWIEMKSVAGASRALGDDACGLHVHSIRVFRQLAGFVVFLLRDLRCLHLTSPYHTLCIILAMRT